MDDPDGTGAAGGTAAADAAGTCAVIAEEALAHTRRRLDALVAELAALAHGWVTAPEPPEEDYEGTTEGHWAFGEWIATRECGKRIEEALAAHRGRDPHPAETDESQAGRATPIVIPADRGVDEGGLGGTETRP